MLDYVAAHPGLRIVGYSPLLQGGIADPERMPDGYRTPDNEKRRAVPETVASETGTSTSQVVLAWMMASPQEVIPLVASFRAEQLL
ncbi:aldo/keto reductase [Sinorhizobium chiapasense]|uniref:Aldo/keto reductase n=1 Tax=Sinorhizobium chiapasense TaxID=501572 RepID=A0ABZ2BFX6_9HYPH